jgi:hypothetical protein
MNCKPGDLAVIVKPGTTHRNLGKLVVVKNLLWDDMWNVEALSPCHKENGRYETWGFIEDHRLRPLRDPGDDAVDETILWLGSPTKEAA